MTKIIFKSLIHSYGSEPSVWILLFITFYFISIVGNYILYISPSLQGIQTLMVYSQISKNLFNALAGSFLLLAIGIFIGKFIYYFFVNLKRKNEGFN